MLRRMTDQERQEFLTETHVGVRSVASDDDRPPLTVPVWYGYEPGGDVSFFTGTQGRKARKTGLIEKASVLSLTVQREEFPYKYITVEGAVIQTDRAVRGANARRRPLAPARGGGSEVRRSGARTSLKRARALHDPSGPLADRQLHGRGEVRVDTPTTHGTKEKTDG